MAYIEAKDRNPFGEDFDERILEDAGRDSTWLEGYSNKRIAREHAVRRGENPPPLEHRFHLARAKTMDGQRADGQRVFHWQTKMHYKAVEWDEEAWKAMGIDPTQNPAFHKGEDGLVYNGTNLLMVADRKVAATNWKKMDDENEMLKSAAANRMASAGEAYTASTGAADPTFSDIEDPRGSHAKIATQPTTGKSTKRSKQ